MLHVHQYVEIQASKYHAESTDGCAAHVVEICRSGDVLVEVQGTGDLYYIPATRLRPVYQRAAE